MRQICWLREAAWRAAALEGWQARGWHSSKFRHLAKVLAPAVVVQLQRVMGVPLVRDAWTRLRRQWPPFVRTLARTRRPCSLPPVLEDPGYLFAQAKEGLPIDAVLEARQALRTHLPTAVWTALQDGRMLPRARRSLPEGLAAVWAALHGLPPSGPDERDVINVHAALAALLPRLPASRHLLRFATARTPSRARRFDPRVRQNQAAKPLEISMKTKSVGSPAKKSVTVNDLKTKRNPKGGDSIGFAVTRPAEFKTIGKRIGSR